MPSVLYPGRIITIDTAADVDKAMKALGKESIVGIDTETRPSFRKGVQYNVSLLQLSTADTCFLIRLCHWGCRLAGSLSRKPRNNQGGCIVARRLPGTRTPSPLQGRWFFDLQKHVGRFGIEEMSLQKIYAIIFGEKISKSQQLTNWEKDVLTDKQKLYAATDAWACLKIYEKLEQTRTR